jgi:hypothetical protein
MKPHVGEVEFIGSSRTIGSEQLGEESGTTDRETMLPTALICQRILRLEIPAGIRIISASYHYH